MRVVLQPRRPDDLEIHGIPSEIANQIREAMEQVGLVGHVPLCGQACVAMLAGCGLTEAIMATECGLATEGEDLVKGLLTLGVRAEFSEDDRRIITGQPAILRLDDTDNNQSHWLLWTGGHFICPTFGVRLNLRSDEVIGATVKVLD